MSRSFDSCVEPCPLRESFKDCAELEREMEMAKLSAAAYEEYPQVEGFKTLDPVLAEETQWIPDPTGMGVMPVHVKVPRSRILPRAEGRNFKAAVFQNEKTGEIIVAYRGSEQPTESPTDWYTNAAQEFGAIPAQYRDSRVYAEAVKKTYGSAAPITFTGHSKGGGQATYAALATGSKAHVFNAAGLGSGTKAALGERTSQAMDLIQNTNIEGELLSNPSDGKSLAEIGRAKLAGFLEAISVEGSPASKDAKALRKNTSTQMGRKRVIAPANKKKGKVERHLMDEVNATLNKAHQDMNCSPAKSLPPSSGS